MVSPRLTVYAELILRIIVANPWSTSRELFDHPACITNERRALSYTLNNLERDGYVDVKAAFRPVQGYRSQKVYHITVTGSALLQEIDSLRRLDYTKRETS